MTSHHTFHPPLKPRPTGSLVVANSGERRHHWSRPILGRRLPEKDATYARAKVRRPSDGECLDVKGSFLKPSGVVDDENERTEMDLAALSQSTTRNHDDGDRTNCNFTNKSLRHLPQGGRQLSWI